MAHRKTDITALRSAKLQLAHALSYLAAQCGDRRVAELLASTAVTQLITAQSLAVTQRADVPRCVAAAENAMRRIAEAEWEAGQHEAYPPRTKKLLAALAVHDAQSAAAFRKLKTCTPTATRARAAA